MTVSLGSNTQKNAKYSAQHIVGAQQMETFIALLLLLEAVVVMLATLPGQLLEWEQAHMWSGQNKFAEAVLEDRIDRFGQTQVELSLELGWFSCYFL